MSKQTDYAVQLLTALATSGEKPLSLRTFAKERTISFLFLQKIARKLKAAGFIHATQGAKGGYTLAQPAEKLTLKEVMDALEGGCKTVSCLKKTSTCALQSHCQSRSAFYAIQQEVNAVMSKYTIEDMKAYATSK